MASDDHVPGDRQILSTDNNEYATGLNDETEWDENILDYDVPPDDEVADYFENPDEADRPVYNESGFDGERLQ